MTCWFGLAISRRTWRGALLNGLLAVFVFAEVSEALAAPNAPAAAGVANGKAKPAKGRASVKSTEFNEETMAVIEEKTEEYRSKLEERARKALNRDFLDGRYVVVVAATPNVSALKQAASKDGTIALSTLPSGVSRGKLERLYIENIPAAAFKNYVSKVEVRITVDQRIPESQQKLAENLVRTSLNLPATAMVTVSTADLENTSATKAVSQAKEEITQAKEQAKEQVTQAKELAQSVKEEKFRLETELRSLKSDIAARELNLRQVSGENETLKSRIKEIEETLKLKDEEIGMYKTPLGEVKKLIKGLELPLTVFPIAVLALIVVIVVSLVIASSNRKRASILKEGVETISAALAKVGNKPGKQGSEVPHEKLIQELQANNQNSAQNSAISQAGTMAAEEAATLKHDAEAAWAELWKHSFLAKCEMREWFSSGAEGGSRFLSVVSALPPGVAAQVLDSFSPDELREFKDTVVDVNLKFMGYSHILSLHRAVLAAMSRAPALARTAEARNLIYASDDIVAKAIVSIESTVAAAVLLLLPTSRWARVLELAANNADIQVITEILSRMTSSQQPQEQEQLAALQTVEALLETLLQEERVSRSTVIIEELVANMETFGPRVKSALDMAQTQDERLAQEIMSRTTTFENVLMLDGDTIREFIDPYDSEQLAQIIIALNETQRREFLKHIRGRTRITVESDFRRLSGSASMRRKAAAQGRQYMSEMVAQLKDMAAQGLVEIPRIGANSKNTSRETA